jgi:hypothetical protein
MFITSVAVFGFFMSGIAFGAKGLTAQSFPQTFADVPFTKKLEVKKAGYEPYKDMRAYVIPDFKDTDDNFKKQMCERDHEECCRRWPDYKGCQPQIGYELFDGDKSKCTKQSAPESYQTNVGANITCIPTRKHSKFVAWCKDAGLKDCAPTQTIAVGEKDDKFFYAKWKCEAPYEPKLNACVCHDPNMDEDDNCQCNGAGMGYDTTTKKCYCVANDGLDPTDYIVRIENKKCVCINDPSLDPNTGCTEPLVCSDEDHMDSSCNCLPLGKAKEDGSHKCKCIDGYGNFDPNLDIDNNCNPTTPPTAQKEYVFLQCRADAGVVSDFLDKHKNDYNIAGTVPNLLACGKKHDNDIDKCFTPCNAVPIFSPAQINTELASVSEPFCSGNKGRNSHTVWFEDPTTNDKLLYTKAEVDLIFTTLGHKVRKDNCGTYGADHYWYVAAFHMNSDGDLKLYKLERIR